MADTTQPVPWWSRRGYGIDALVGLALAAATALVYAQILGHGFLHYDDDQYVVLNPMVKRGLSLDGLRWAFTSFAQYHWHPLTWLSHMLDVELFGLNPAGHHATSVLLHIGNTLLVFAFFRSCSGERWPSALVAALFALHPTHVESVAWVAGRKDLLVASFGLLSLLLYARYAVALRRRWFALSLVALVLGLMSKTNVIVWPLLYLVIDFWPLRRVHGFTPAGGAEAPTRVVLVSCRRALGEKGWVFGPVLGLAVVAVLANLRGDLAGLERGIPTAHTLAAATDSVLFYAGKTLWPVPLALPYPAVEAIPISRIVAGLALLIGVTAAGVHLRRLAPWLLMGWLWYLVSLLPASGITRIGTELRADRYTYLPTIGLFVMLAWGGAGLARRWPMARRPLVACALVLLIACGLSSARYARLFAHEAMLFQHTVSVTSDNVVAYTNLAVELHHQGRLDEALAYYDRALRIDPRDYDANFNRARLLRERGRYAEALATMDGLTQRRVNSADFAAQRAEILAALGRQDEAEQEYRRALQLDPALVPALNNYALLLAERGQLKDAAAQLERVLLHRPHDVSVLGNLGNVYLLGEDYERAASAYGRVLEHQPDNVEASYRLGAIRAYRGQLDDAIALYRVALQRAPERPDVLTDLASALAQQGRLDEARTTLRQALRADPRFEPARAALAALEGAGASTSQPGPQP